MDKGNLLIRIAGSFFTAVLITVGSMCEKASAQNVSIATGLPSSASSGSSTAPSVITFCIDNARSTPVTLKAIDAYMSTSNTNTTWKLFYSATSLSGSSNITTWTLIDSVAGPSVSSTGIYGLFSTLNFPIPASTTYRFALQTSASIINYGGATTTPNSQTVSNISLYRGNYVIGGSNVGYAGSATAPPFQPRFFCGTVYLDTTIANCSGTPVAPLITTAAINPASPVCAGTTKALTGSHSFVNGITYQWQSASSATGPWNNVTNGTGATTLNYTTGPLSSSTFFRVGAICTNSNIANYSSAYQVLVGSPQPGAITGNSTFCPGNPTTYSVPAVTGTTYAWTLPTGWSGTSTTSSITATPSNTAGNISVIATSSCGTSIAQTYAVLPGSAPAQPGTVTGNAPICGNTTQTYSVLPVTGATSYTWTLPSGWSGTSTSNTITTTASGTGGTVAVTANNGCGPSTARNLTVNVITALANPGTIIGPTTTCSGVMYNYTINPVPGATSYTWTFPSGWSGTTSGTSIQAFPGMTSGNVNVTAFVSCATSPTSSKAVTVTPTLTPSVTIATPVTTICQGLPITFTATPVNGGTTPLYQWKKNGVNVAGAGSTYLNNGLVTGDVITVEMTSTYACPSSTTATSNAITASVTPSVVPGVNISTTPTINICKGTPLTFNTNITGGGTAPTYQWFKNGAMIGGATAATYTDATLSDKDTLTVQLSSNAVCATMPSVMSNKVLVSVTDLVVPSITITASSTTLNGAPITFTAVQSGGGTTPQYQWMKNNVAIPLATGDTYTATGLKNGDRITVRMLSIALCASPEIVTSNEIAVSSPLSIAGVGGWDGSVGLYPNPTTGKFTIGASWGNAHIGKRVSIIDVMNAVGQSVYHSEVAPDRAEWHYDVQLAEGLANGSYMLRIAGDGMRAVIPFILNR